VVSLLYRRVVGVHIDVDDLSHDLIKYNTKGQIHAWG
jgi:hypothetical protein